MNNLETEISIIDLSNYWIEEPVTVIHCGAHLAEELEEYEGVGWQRIVWIESNPNLIPRLTERLNGHDSSTVVNATLWSRTGERLKLKVANNSYSSSILDFGTHAETYPDITFESEIEVQTQTLDLVLSNLHDIIGAFLVLDLQGAELETLLGGASSLFKFDYIYTEVSKSNLYQDQGSWDQISDLLLAHEFKLVDWQYSPELNWGNALYKRSPKSIQSRRIRRKRNLEHQRRLKSSGGPR